jgi:hypothetical protein
MSLAAVIPGGQYRTFALSHASKTLTVPLKRIYLIDWFALTYIADATVATRGIAIIVRLLNTDYALLENFQTITASLTSRFSYGLGVDPILYSYPSSPGRELVLYPGQKIEVIETNWQAGDTWTSEGVYREIPFNVPGT